MIVNVSAGGSVDAIARILAAELSTRLGQPFVVDNKAGAEGNIAAMYVKRAKPDGYTLFVTSSSTMNINVLRFKNLGFDPQKDFVPIVQTANVNFALLVQPSLHVSTLAEFIQLAKSKPGQLNYGSFGAAGQLVTEIFNQAAGIEAHNIPYKGMAPAINDLVGGQLDYMFDSGTGVPQVKAGKLVALAVVGPRRLKALPDVDVLPHLGIKGAEAAVAWHGIFAPAGTPPAVVQKLNEQVREIMQMPSVRERIEALGVEPVSGTPEELAKRLGVEIQAFAPLVKKLNLTAE